MTTTLVETVAMNPYVDVTNVVKAIRARASWSEGK